MTDLLDSAFEAVGKAAKPLAPAIDFLAPRTEPGGQDLSVGGLINSLGRGVESAFQEGLFGLGAAAYGAATAQGMSARERLMLGGLAAAGGAMSARAIHTGWKANQPQRMFATARRPVRDVPGGYPELTEGLGDPKRFIDVTDETQALLYERPGLNRRQAQILASDDPMSVARGFVEFDPSDEVRLTAAAGLFQTYADSAPQGAFGAQIDWARFSYAMDSGIVRGTPGNRKIRKLWKEAVESTEKVDKDGSVRYGLDQTEAEELFSAIRDIGDATDGITADDLSIGLAGKVSAIDFVDGRARFYVSHPVGWNDGMSTDPLVRAKRLQQLNVRALAPRGKRMLRQLFDIGDQQYKLFQETGETSLPKGMHLGRDWYPVAFDDTAKAFGIDPTLDPTMMDRAVAAVSFLSEAEDWSTNVYKARRILDIVGDVSDPDFQSWLKHNVMPDAYDGKVPRHKYAGSKAQSKAHEKRFKEVFETVKKGPPGEGGFKVDKTTMKKVLRLYGGVEPVMDVFRSTKARKQKNFFLNIRHPDGDWPVTIDRHAYDAFYGLDSGVQDRPIDAMLGAGDQTYDVIADTYRAVAAELTEEARRLNPSAPEVLPHQVQAVIWEVWRIMKGSQGKNGWGWNLDGVDMPSPFMMTLDDEVTNPVFDALMGRTGLTGALGQDLSGPVPVSLLDATDVDGLSAASVGDEYVVLADIDDKVAATVRSKTPGVVGADRITRWVDTQPLSVKSIDEYLAPIQDNVHWLEHTVATDHAGGLHPALRGRETIVAYLPDGAKASAPKGTRARRAGRATVDTQELSFEKLGPDDIDPENWTGAKSPLNTHAWAAISANTTPDADNLGAHNRLRAELQRRGYKPIETEGWYKGQSESSFVVFGISQREAREIGELFSQESVITNDGWLYSRNAPIDDAGRRQPATGMEVNPPPPKDKAEPFNRSELLIGDQRLTFRQDLDFSQTDEVLDDFLDSSVARSRQRVEVDIPAGKDINELVSELEGRGFEDLSVYANVDRLNGFERAYDRVVTDGAAVTVIRTADGAITDPHGSHVFVRSASGLPKQPKKPPAPGWQVTGDGVAIAGNTLMIDGRFPSGMVEFSGPFQAKLNGQSPIAWGYVDGTLTPIFDELELASGRFQATIKGNKITPADEADLTPAIRAAQHLRDAGYPDHTLKNAKGNVQKLELKTSAGSFKVGEPKVTNASSEVVTTRNGLTVPSHHRDAPVTRFEEMYGIEFDGGWRDGSTHVKLDEPMVDQVQSGVGLVWNEHEAVIHRARLRGISTENMDPKLATATEVPYAYFSFAPDQRIVLNREFFENPALFEATLRENRAQGWLSPRVEPTPRSIIVHELGHVMHLSGRLGEGMVNDSQLERAIYELMGGRRGWSKVAEREISVVAGTDISELVAESVSEVLLADRPSKLARDVYQVLTDRLGEYMKNQNMRADPPMANPRRVSAMALSAQEASEMVTDQKLWGGGLEAMFPSDSLKAPTPFPSVGKHKKLQAFDQSLVDEAVRRGETTQIDPRTLHATQPSVTRDGVKHYIDSPDTLYADIDQAGNQVPVVYRRDEGNGRVRSLILSGTHRAAAALAQGRSLTAIVVDGPWGPPRGAAT